jgi:hypothetical protein
VLVIWLDPPSIGLLDPSGQRVVYSLQDNSFRNTIAQGFVSVAGNVEVLVLPFVPTGVQSYLLAVADVPATARGGAVYLGRDGSAVQDLTAGLRGGTTQFQFSFGQAAVQSQQPLAAPNPSPATVPSAADTEAPAAPVATAGSAPLDGTPTGPTLSPTAALALISPDCAPCHFLEG